MQSKKHKENENRPNPRSKPVSERPPEHPDQQNAQQVSETAVENMETKLATLSVDEQESADQEASRPIEEKIAAARARLTLSHCLFCPQQSPDLPDNLTHMSSLHSFFIPDADYLVDLPGLITYLGEKLAVGNVCVYCNDKGREFRSLEAVRKHMIDKSHCKIAYESETDRLEVSDYYDFTSSYPDTQHKKKKHSNDDQDWEDVEGDGGDADEIVDEEGTSESGEDSDELPDTQISYGDSHLELVLPSGARIGHRSLKRYYDQSFPSTPRGGKTEDPNSGAALVRRLVADKNSALVPRKGGFGAFGAGTDVVKARNRGEAREAGRHVREFRDQRRREQFKTKVGFIHNSQKHFRDPCTHILSLFDSYTHHHLLSSASIIILRLLY